MSAGSQTTLAAGSSLAGSSGVDATGLHGGVPLRLPNHDPHALFGTRLHDSHKGSHGTVAVLGGAPGMTGAALLASRAALRLGAGKVLTGLAMPPGPGVPVCDLLQPELMLRDAVSLLAVAERLGVTVWVVGCGLGDDAAGAGLLAQCVDQLADLPVVLDADALNLMARDIAPPPALATASLRVLTPHPREAGRLLHCTAAEVQADRAGHAYRLAVHYDAWVVLKGAGTVVCSPDGNYTVNDSGNPGLATAGTGDVLAGMIGSLLAQGLAPADAIRGAVWLHGAAADALVAEGVGPIGLVASELIDVARALRNAGPDHPLAAAAVR